MGDCGFESGNHCSGRRPKAVSVAFFNGIDRSLDTSRYGRYDGGSTFLQKATSGGRMCTCWLGHGDTAAFLYLGLLLGRQALSGLLS